MRGENGITRWGGGGEWESGDGEKQWDMQELAVHWNGLDGANGGCTIKIRRPLGQRDRSDVVIG